MSILVFIITFLITLEYCDSRNRRRYPAMYKGWLDAVIELEGENFRDAAIREQSFKVWAAKKDREWQKDKQQRALNNTLWLESQGYTFPWYRWTNPQAPVVAA